MPGVPWALGTQWAVGGNTCSQEAPPVGTVSSHLLLLLSRFSRVRLCATPRQLPTRLPHPWDSPGMNTGVGCHFLLQCMKMKSESEVAQSCPTLRNPMDCSLPGSSAHGIFQARVLEWGAITFECNCVVAWAFFGIAFLWNWNENWSLLFLVQCEFLN